MPSTYTLNNGIELIGTGEQSGSWGDTTNANLSLIDTALDGQVTVTLASAGSSGSPNTLPISDGAASNGRNRMIIFDDGGDLGATAYVQLTPNDAEKIIYVRNDLSGSRSIVLFQGTYNASNDYEVPAGTTAVVYFDGGGTGAVAANVFNNAHFDALNVAGTANIDSLVATTADINGGTIDGTVIGGTTPAAISGTTGTFSGDLTVDTDTLFVDASTNRVGIETSNPAEPLHVIGTIRSETSSTGDFNFYATSTGGGAYRIYPDDATTANPTWLHQSNSSEDQAWVIGGVERMRIDSDGNVGIGTDSPSSILHVSGADPEIFLTDTSTGVDHSIDGNSGVGNLFVHVDKNNEGSDPKFVLNIGATSDVIVANEAGIVEIAEGSVVLNGSTISAIQVTVADDAVAQITFPNRRFGMLNVVEGADDTSFPDIGDRFFGYVDFGNSPGYATISIGGNTEIDDTNTLTGTTGTDGKVTIGVAGTSGTLYIENRNGSTQTFSVTLL